MSGEMMSFLAMDPRTGGVLAMVGGVDFAASQFTRALQARRQPGSAFKPVIYAAALDKGKTVVSAADDSPIEFEKSETEMWKPKNYDGTFLGPIPLLEALAKSRNLATVRLLNDIGVDTAIRMARDIGIESPIERNLSIALGSSGVTPLEMVTAYSTFAAGGQRPTPFFIRQVQDGGVYLPPNDSTMPDGDGVHVPPEALGLTARQTDVLKLLAQGKPNKLICRDLRLSEGTVKVHISAILKALNVASRTQAVAELARRGIHVDLLRRPC